MPKFEVVEKIQIDVAPENVRAIVRDFKQWSPWSPWLSAEPDCQLDFAEDGSSYSWDGKVIGSGNVKIATETDDALHFDLSFLKPWKSSSKVAFYFTAKDGGTEVAWTMLGSLPFFLFFMKKMMIAFLAADFRRGLCRLKDYAETGSVPSKNEFAGVGKGVVGSYVGLRAEASLDDIGDKIGKQLERLHHWLGETSIESKGPPLAIYHKFDVGRNTTEYTVAVPVESIPGELPDDFVSGRLDAMRTYKVKHTGAYRHVGAAWSAGMMHQRNKLFQPNKKCDPFEVYVSDPISTPELELITEVHLPAN